MATPYGREYADESTPVLPNPPDTYASYPYASTHSPYMLAADLRPWLTPEQAASVPSGAIGRAWAGRLNLDGGYLLGVAHGSVGARLLTPSRFDLAVSGKLMYESAARERAQLFALELGLRVLQLDAIMVRVFAALQNFEQAGFDQYGGELGIEADIFVGRPWVVSMRASGAQVGEAFVSTFRVQLGYLFERYELFAGYQDYRIGEVNLSAPIVGTRIWL